LFTGIVEEIGTVASISAGARAYSLRIDADVVLGGTKLGDSIAVNGTCLTVTSLSATSFTVDVAPETRSRTNLAQLVVRDAVNLERAVTPTTRLGGHLVQGHVDGLGTITDLYPDGEALWVTIRASTDILRYVVPKGFISLDGVSLTVVDVSSSTFNIMLVPHTQNHIILPRKSIGYHINIEVDIIGKYVEKFVAPFHSGTTLTLDKLRENGFM
jgi:riboflavin synthase